MDYQSAIRDHIELQLKKSRLPYSERFEEVSFYNLSPRQKKELATYELMGPDGDDMIINHDGAQLTQLLFSYYNKKNITAEQVIDFLMDGIIKRYSTNLSEKFDEEAERYAESQRVNLQICRSAERSGDPDAHQYI